MRQVLVCMGVLLVACCGDASRSGDPRAVAPRSPVFGDPDRATIFVGRPADAIGLDPARQSDNESVEVCEQVFEHLIRTSPVTGQLEPALATQWESSEHGTVWTFHLRPGVRFHDGTSVDADAVVFSFERQRDPSHPFHSPEMGTWESGFHYVEKVEAVDPLTVRITVERPYAPLLASLATFPVSIVSPTAVRKWGDEFQRHPVGTGPFRFVSWDRGDRIVLERNTDYWGPQQAELARLVFRTIPDARQRLVALEGGAVDVAYSLLPEELQFVELHPRLRLTRVPASNVAYLAMNTTRAPLDDVDVRRAINHAINKIPIVKLAYQGLGVPAWGPLPPSIWSHRSDVVDYPYDPRRARSLLEAAAARGRLDRKRVLTLYVPRTPRVYLPDPERVARVIQENLLAAGIHTKLVVQDFGAHLADVRAGKHDLCLMGWTGDNVDPDNFLWQLDRDSTTPGTARNVAFYNDAELHGILVYARETFDRAERERYYKRAQEIIAAAAPWVPLAHSQVAVAMHERVRGLVIDPTGLISYRPVHLVGEVPQ